MADSNLSGDVETDGECVAPAIRHTYSALIAPVKSTSAGENNDFPRVMHGRDISQSLKSDNFDPTHESGYGSMSSQFSLSSPISPASSFRGVKVEPAEKKPVQCSEVENDAADLSSKLSKLELLEEKDEGIESLTFQSTSDVSVPEPVDNLDLEDVLTEEDGDGDTILHNTILNEMMSVIFCLIEICPKVSLLNTPNRLFQTPLHLAVLTNLVEVVRKLVQQGADVLVRDQQGNTPLHIACRTGNKEIIETIVESVKSDSKRLHKLFTLKNSEGLTCLHIAAEKKQYIIMGYLMANGADVNIGDAKSGRTVLHYAVERRDMETVKVLLTHKNIDIDCVTFKGESPLVIAYWRNYQDIVKKLRSKGAYFSFDLVDEWDEEEVSQS